MKKFSFKNIKESVKGLYLSNKKVFILAVSLMCIVIVIAVSVFIPSSKNDKKSQIEKQGQVSVTDYATQVENKLNSMLLSIESVKKVSTFVMVESTPKIEYLTESENVTTTNSSGTSSSTLSTTVVFEKNGSISTPVVVTTILPKVTGVLIVLNNVSASTKFSIIKAVSIVLNIDESCISILQES